MKNKFSQYKLFKWASRPYGISREFFYLKSMCDAGMKFFMVIPEKDGIIGSYYFDEPSYKKVLEKMYIRVLGEYRQHISNYQPSKNKILLTSKKLSDSIGKVSDKKLFELYNDYIKSIYNFFDYVFLPFALIEYTEPELNKIFEKDFELIIDADQPTEYQLMEKMLLEQGPQKTLNKYKWLNSYYIGEEPFTLKEMVAMRGKLDKKEIEKTFLDFSKNKKKFGQFIKQITDRQLKAKCILFHEYTYLRNDRLDSWKYSLYLVSDFFRYLENKFSNVSIKAVANLSYDEISDILTKGHLPDEKSLRKREKNLAYYYDGKLTIVTDKKAITEIKKEVQNQVYISGDLKGVASMPGVVRARVVIINSNKELAKVKKGDVLVAKVTDPRYTPAMRLASAIVTDEGGMLSHAAITSRELRVPCIVGTKYATQVLKDGDMVEVDANNGIIKKIN